VFLEIVEIRIRPGEQVAFEEAITRALTTITAKAHGMKGYKLIKCVESPERYIMETAWATIEDHMVVYRQSQPREEWLRLVKPFFAQAPVMEHFTHVTQSK
jgi:quinol monooxygenase YgiN